MDSRLYWIWLAQALGAGEPSMGDLLDAFTTAEAVYSATDKELQAAGIGNGVVRRLKDKSLDEARTIFNRVMEAGDWVLTPDDALYPVNLHRLSDRPAALYCRGTMPDMDKNLTVAVVGTRRASQEGWQEAYRLTAGLAAGGAIVVSGGAKGIDAAAHAGALENGGITVAVMGCPVDERYPVENIALRERIVADGGLLMSEYPHGQPYRCIYQVRNRLLAGLCHGVCLGETPIRSGARITARLAREQGRDVFALPGSLVGHRNDGAHREIRGGASLVTCAAELLEEFTALFPDSVDIEAAKQMYKDLDIKVTQSPEREEKVKSVSKQKAVPIEPSLPTTGQCPDAASPTARKVYEALTTKPCPVDELAAKTELSVAALLGALTELEMFGCAANAAGQQYYRV